MTLRDIICSSCSDVALSVAQDESPSNIVNMRCCCYSCECLGAVEQVDEDGQAKLVFRADEIETPPVPELTLVPSLHGLIALQVAEEKERQRGWIMTEGVWHSPPPPVQWVDLFEMLKNSLGQATKV